MAEAIAFYEHEKQPVISRAFHERMRGVDSFDVVRPLYERLRAQVERPTFLETMTYIELRLRLPELLLMRADKMAMAHSIELRVPFLDKRLVEFALSAPQEFKLRDGVSKEPVKRLAARLTEAESPASRNGSIRDLYYRPKSGFGAPIQDWFGSRLGGVFRDHIEADRAALGEYFDVDRILASLQDGAATVNRAYQLWVLFTFAVWKRRFGL
jgi:asparagine synthase (glutamine-hydrolysing)